MIQIWDSGNVIVPVGYCPFGAYHHAEEYKSGQSGQKKSYGLQKAMIWGPLKDSMVTFLQGVVKIRPISISFLICTS